MAELAPVPAPRSPFRGWHGWAVGVVVVGLLVAIVKPWGETSEPLTARPSASAAPAATATDPPRADPVLPEPDPGIAFDPAVLGARSPDPAWTLITASARTALPIASEPGPDGPPTEGAGRPDIAAGPVIELGTADEAAAVAIAHPRAASLGAVRLWRFGTDGAPQRIDLDEAPSPWPVDHVEVLVGRGTGTAPGRVHGWAPGLYRLDLLIEPADVVRSVMLVVRPAAGTPGSGGQGSAIPTDPADDGFQPSDLRLLPPAANLWALGDYLSGWRRAGAPADCRVAEIWRSTDPRDPCWPVPLGPTEAVGVNLDGIVRRIDLALVDPLPGPAGATSGLSVDGRRGLAYVRAPAGGLTDGIYRLDVATTAGSLTWYLEVGPIGRAVAEYYASATSR